MLNRKLLGTICAAAVFANMQIKEASAAAQNYPNRPVTIVVAFAPGASTDGLARILAKELDAKLGANFIIENKPGGIGVIAANAVMKAKPDGYTLLLASTTTFAINPHMYKSVTYDPMTDFTTIASLCTGQNILAVNPKVPVKSIQELISYAKDNPTKLFYGSNSGTSLVGSEVFNAMAGVKIAGVSYKNVSDQISDVVTGRTSVVILDQFNAAPLLKAGSLRGLAVTGPHRSKLVPELPTLAESGLEGYHLASWIGLAGPASMPQDVVRTLNKAVNEVVSTPEFAEKLASFGYEPFIHTPEQATASVKADNERWARMIKTAKIEKK